jgi:protein-tyrosine phosphatase
MMAYWIDTGLSAKMAIMQRPKGGAQLDDEIRALRSQGAGVLVSLLTADEVFELALEHEPALCALNGIVFRSFPIRDRSVPESPQAFLGLIHKLHGDLLQGHRIVAHCRAGIGRSSLLLASLLRREGLSALDAFHRITQARGMLVPDTPEQLHWVESLKLPTPGSSVE